MTDEKTLVESSSQQTNVDLLKEQRHTGYLAARRSRRFFTQPIVLNTHLERSTQKRLHLFTLIIGLYSMFLGKSRLKIMKF